MNLQRFSQKTQKFQIQQLNISNGFFPQKKLLNLQGFYFKFNKSKGFSKKLNKS